MQEKNEFGYKKGTRKDLYCQLLLKGIYSKPEILKAVKEKFGSASGNAFNFFLRDLRLSGYTIISAPILKLVPKKK
ncbi:unnamed protein product [marine sediment metagenome]|uniref:Uncharacterized protein n=1 Tax=marine sediment metagenome TaxID=412755 RepID=X1K6D1_9ZZZZ